MSVEFEKVVLEKLKVLDELKFEVSNLSKKVEQLEEKFNNNTVSISSLSKKIDINTELIASLSKNVKHLEEKVDIQGKNLASFENEFTIKVQALFDSFVSNTQSHLSYEKSIAALNAENFRQGARISKLEDYFNGAKILATN